MSTAMRRPMTVNAFIAWEERQPTRWEFDGVEPVAMTGGTAGHGMIQANLMLAVGGRLRGRPSRILGSDVKIVVAGSVRYPDGFVVCTPVDRSATLVTDPVVVFEVLIPSKAGMDYFVKNREYRDTPSIRRYVMLEQDVIGATVFARDDDDWVGHVLVDGDVLAMPEISVELPLAELYEGITFGDPETAAPAV